MNPSVGAAPQKMRKVFFEDALDKTGYGRYNLAMFMLCGSIMMGMAFEIYSVSYLVPASVCELQTTNTQQGFVASVPLVGIIATSHIWGYLADTRGRKKVLVISMTMSFLSGSLAAFSSNWILLCLLKLISSASVAGAFALSTAFLSECTPRAKRSSLIILLCSIFLISIGSMAIIAIPILPLKFSYYIPVLNIYFNSWRLLCIIFALPCAISALGAVFAYESPKYLLAIGKNEEALELLKEIYAINNIKNSNDYPVDNLVLDEDSRSMADKGLFESIKAQTVPMLKPPLLKYTILLSTLFVLIYISVNSLLVWVPFIVSAFMTSVQNGNSHATICEMIRSYQNSTVVEELVGAFAAFGINNSPYWILTAVLFFIYLTGALNFGFLNTFSVDIYPTYVRAMAVCLTLMVGRGSAVFGINVLKQLLDNHCEYVFYIFGSVTCLGGVIGFLLPSDAKILERKKLLQQDT